MTPRRVSTAAITCGSAANKSTPSSTPTSSPGRVRNLASPPTRCTGLPRISIAERFMSRPRPRRRAPLYQRAFQLDGVDLDLSSLDAHLQDRQPRKSRVVLVARLAIRLKGRAMARALELIAELAVVEDATHVGADRGQCLDVLPMPDEKSLDAPRAEGDRYALRKLRQGFDRLPAPVFNQLLARWRRRRLAQTVETHGSGHPGGDAGDTRQQQRPATGARRWSPPRRPLSHRFADRALHSLEELLRRQPRSRLGRAEHRGGCPGAEPGPPARARAAR